MFRLVERLQPVTLEQASGLSGTKAKLLTAGERLFGIHSLSGVSLEQVCLAAGQSNKFAIQYHFGSKKDFVETIILSRLNALNDRRGGLLVQARKARKINLEALVEIFYLPMAEQTDEDGRHTFSLFLLQFLLQFETWSEVNPLVEFKETMPHTREVVEAIAACLPHVSLEQVEARLLLASTLMPTALMNLDRRSDVRDREAELDVVIPQVLGMIADAMRGLERRAIAAGSSGSKPAAPSQRRSRKLPAVAAK